MGIITQHVCISSLRSFGVNPTARRLMFVPLHGKSLLACVVCCWFLGPCGDLFLVCRAP
jgi:hypothetical protein